MRRSFGDFIKLLPTRWRFKCNEWDAELEDSFTVAKQSIKDSSFVLVTSLTSDQHWPQSIATAGSEQLINHHHKAKEELGKTKSKGQINKGGNSKRNERKHKYFNCLRKKQTDCREMRVQPDWATKSP